MVGNYRLKDTSLIIFIILISHLVVLYPLPRSLSNTFNERNEFDSIRNSINFEWNTSIMSSSGNDITLDNQDNIYITGKQYNSSEDSFDIFLVKYNRSKDLMWNLTWGGNNDDLGYAIKVDASNNVYITGETKSCGDNNGDLVLIKFNHYGELEWYKTWGGNQLDIGYSLTIDKSDNIFIIGYTESYGVLGDVSLLKFNSSGGLEWNRTWGGIDTDLGYDIIMDSDENIYFTGYTSSFGVDTSNLLLVKSNKNGDIQWNITWGDIFPDEGRKLVVDSVDNIFIVGNTQNYGAGNNDIVVLKFNSSSNLIWNTTWGGSEHDYGYSITLDSKDNIYVVGYTTSYDGDDKDVFVLQLNQIGSLKWSKYWGGDFDDIGYSIIIDKFNSILITGETERYGNNYDMILLEFSPIPDDFKLSSNADFPDPDGNLTLSWSTSLDADNYSLYQFNRTINKINSSLTELVNGNINRTHHLRNLEEDIYYFLVVAFNEYGNTSSNCLKIKVQFPPSEFILYNNSKIPDTDGMVYLTWSISKGAANYSVYIHHEYINDVKEHGTLIMAGIENNYYLLGSLTNGDYYIVIEALNDAGKYLSNCILIVVRRAPISFNLTTDAEDPDPDGNFTLLWTKSEFAQYYTIYFINRTDSPINSSAQILCNFTPLFNWPTYQFAIFEWKNGTYNFKIVAFNDFGNSSTEWIRINVSISRDEPVNDEGINDSFYIIPHLIPYILLGCFLGFIIFIYKKRSRKR